MGFPSASDGFLSGVASDALGTALADSVRMKMSSASIRLRVLGCAAWVGCWAAVSTAVAQPLASEQRTLSPDVDPTGVEYRPADPSALVSFNLEDADLPELLRMMSQISGRGFIVANKTRNIKATVYGPTKIPMADAYEAFLSILELNGMTVVPAGPYLKVVESAHIESRALPLSVEGELAGARDAYVTQLRPLRHISAQDAAAVLEQLKSNTAGLTVYAPTNLLIITETRANLKRLLRVLDEIDVAPG
jgi:type II secretory pathway component GspD/PulD (secretin)